MDITITPRRLSGTVSANPSKSHAHRLLICAALAERDTLIRLNGTNDDINATCRCLKTMGAEIETVESGLLVRPIAEQRGDAITLDCGESGATARFLLPVAASLYENYTLTGKGRLPERPFAPLCETLATGGCSFDRHNLPLTGNGKLRAGDFHMPGNVSSQYISGMLFALPLLNGDSRIILSTELESRLYVDMTVDALRRFGISLEETHNGFAVPGNQKYISPGTAETDGDWSGAAFFLCMGAMNGDVTLTGISEKSIQGDKKVLEILKDFGAIVNGFSVRKGKLRGIEIDASQIPDLVPVLAVAAAAAEGTTRIYNAGRLRFKESDRLQTTRDLIVNLGGGAEITEDGLLIRGKEKLTGGTVDGAGDHRIVMAAATAACVCESPVVIKGAEAVNKSYPGFFEELEGLAKLKKG